jgi:ABC-type nitrate/sulfonate/bicarbonate transport system substrate-binding protein
MTRRISLPLAAIGLVAILLAGCGDDDGGELQQVTFMAGFRPQANLPFVAVYVADAKGYFEDEGLDVDIQHSASGEHLQLLLAGEIDFTTGTAAQVVARRAEDLPVVSIALFGQRGDQGYVVRADSGIDSPEDFAGHSVGFKGGVVPAELRALLEAVGLTEDDVELQAVGFDPAEFIAGAVDVYPVFLDNEPDTIRRAGVEITVFDPADYGVATLGVTYLAHADTVAQDPELVERFLRAALRGAAYAADNPDEAIEVVLQYAEGADAEHQRFLLTTGLQNAQRADGIGRSSPEQWEALVQMLLDHGVISAPVDVATVFDGSFVDALYDENGELR